MAFNKRDKWRRRRRNPRRSIKAVWRVISDRWRPRAVRRGSNAWGWLRRDWPTNALTALAVVAGVIWVPAVIYLSVDLIGLFLGLTQHEGEARFAALRYTVLILVALVGAPFLIWRTVLTARQTKIAQETHFTDLFTNAVQQLGADKIEKGPTGERSVPNLEVRLGAIYALERIMNDSGRDRGPIIETLSAYVRENCGLPAEAKSEPPPAAEQNESDNEHARRLDAINDRISRIRKAWREDLPRQQARTPTDRADVRATLSVLMRRPESAQRPDLGGASFQGANLRRLKLAEIDFQTARLEGVDLSRANLQGADLSGAHLEGADLWWTRLDGVNLQSAHLEGASFARAHLTKADLTRAHLEGARLWHARMEGANLLGAHLENAQLWRAQLKGADLMNAHLDGASFLGAHLEGVDFWGAHFRSSSVSSASFVGSLVNGADFTNCDIVFDQLASAFGDAGTRLPTGADWVDARARLVAEAGWAEDELEFDEALERRATWRKQRGF